MDYEQIKKDLKKCADLDIDGTLFPDYDYPILAETLAEEEKEKFEALWEKMNQVCREHDVVVLGAGDLPIGLSASALVAFKEAERLRNDYFITVNPIKDFMKKPAFLDESKSKLRKGKGHYKLKKGKKK